MIHPALWTWTDAHTVYLVMMVISVVAVAFKEGLLAAVGMAIMFIAMSYAGILFFMLLMNLSVGHVYPF